MKFYLFLLFTLLHSCSIAQESNDAGEVFAKFPAEVKAKSIPLFNITNITVDGLMLYQDSVLFVRNYSKPKTHHFLSYNLKTQAFNSTLLSSGRKVGQSLSFLSYGISGEDLWVHDIIKDKIIFINISAPGKPATEISLPKFYYSLWVWGDDKLIGSGDYDSNYKFEVFDLKLHTVTDSMIPYPSNYTWQHKTAAESFLYRHPSGQKCVLAMRFSDQVEFYDFTSNTRKIIRGPENFTPYMTVMTDNSGRKISTSNAKTRYAFVKGKVTDKYIYLLYSGNKTESDHMNFGKSIFVYNWDGEPVKRILLENYVVDFVVTSDDSVLYTYDPNKKNIALINL